MAFLSSNKVKTSLSTLSLTGLTALLAACGGGSATNGTASSSPGSGSLLAHIADPAQPDRAPQNAPPDASSTATNPSATPSVISSSPSESDGPFGQDASAYNLTFQDSFDGELNRDVWNTERTDSDNATPNYATRNGTLKIWPQRGKNGEFFNRTLDTDGAFSQRYGYFEIDAKLPKGKGVWPAFWLLNHVGDARPEIDIMEAYPGGEAPWGVTGADGVPVPMMYAPVVWTTGGVRAGYGKVATPDLSAGFHRYGVKWEPNKATFYFDGREVAAIDATVSDPLFMILDVWFGSASGSPDDSTPTGEANSLEVNYVKAWQFK